MGALRPTPKGGRLVPGTGVCALVDAILNPTRGHILPEIVRVPTSARVVGLLDQREPRRMAQLGTGNLSLGARLPA